MIYLDVGNLKYLEITKQTRILKPKEIKVMSMDDSVLKKRKELMDMFSRTESAAYNIPVDHKQTWNKSRSIGELVEMFCRKDKQLLSC